MNIETKPSANARMRAAPRQCRDDCSSGARNNYFLGKRMPPLSYQAEQSFLNGRRRLINRAVLGWGVVYGFRLTVGVNEEGSPAVRSVTIGEGLALDVEGRELWQVKDEALTLDELIILDGKGQPVRVDGDLDGRLTGLEATEGCCWLLSAHYAEQKLDRVTLRDDCGCPREEWDRTCETIVYSLRPIDCANCCPPAKCELHCDCPPDTACCDEGDDVADDRLSEAEYQRHYEALLRKIAQAADDSDRRAKLEARLKELIAAHEQGPSEAKQRPQRARGGCACLCEHLTNLQIGADCVRLCDIGDGARADLHHGVPLACLSLVRNDCRRWTLDRVIDACGPRRLIKRNDLLFDLVNGCDLTRIVDTGWKGWHRRDDPQVPFDEFAEALGWDPSRDYASEWVTDKFWVEFSRPVRVASLKADCFVIIVMTNQTEGCWRESYRVPIVGVETNSTDGALATRATIVVDGDWLSDAVGGRGSIFRAGPTFVEIAVRGDFIVDCLGQTVDANARGLSAAPTGGNGPGDDYLSTFTVAQRCPDDAARLAAPRRRAAGPGAQGALS